MMATSLPGEISPFEPLNSYKLLGRPDGYRRSTADLSLWNAETPLSMSNRHKSRAAPCKKHDIDWSCVMNGGGRGLGIGTGN